MDLREFISYSNYKTPSELKKLKFIFDVLNDYSSNFGDLRVLEIGCGTGSISIPIAHLGCKVRAFDIDPQSISQIAPTPNLTATVNNAYTFDEGEIYNVIIISEVLEHLETPDICIANALRFLSPDGLLIVTIPNGFGPWEIANRLLWYRLRKWLRPDWKPSHLQFFQFDAIRLFEPLNLIAFGKSDSIFASMGPFYQKSKSLQEIDIRLSEILPKWLASGWYFAFRRPSNQAARR